MAGTLGPHRRSPAVGDELIGPPARRAVRKSDSSRANRQLRTCPSAVTRTRSQSPQKGRVTDAITPTVAGPPSTRNSSAGAAAAMLRVRRRDRSRAERVEDLVGGDHLVAGPAMLGVERHLLDESQLVAARQAPREQLRRLVVVDAPQQDGVDLDRGEAGRRRGLEAAHDVVEPVAAGDRRGTCRDAPCRG